jgi:hypothetical protein
METFAARCGDDTSVSLVTVLIVLAIVALLLFIFTRWRGR